MIITLNKNAHLGCKSCGELMKNIEYGHPRYYSYCCIQDSCPEKGKIQIHGEWSKPFTRKNEVQ